MDSQRIFQLDRFALSLIGEWEALMDRFYETCDLRRDGLTDDEIWFALNRAHGGDVADGWRTWAEGGGDDD